MTTGTIQLTQNNFEAEVLQSDAPVLVDFFAEWCGPCKRIAPVLEEIAIDRSGEVKIGKVDVDRERELAAAYGIQRMPTMAIFRGGQIVDTITGAVPRGAIEERLDAVLLARSAGT